MAKCPICKREIDSLEVEEHAIMRGVYFGNGDYDGVYRDETTSEFFECPECGEILATEEREADDVLSGEDDEDEDDFDDVIYPTEKEVE